MIKIARYFFWLGVVIYTLPFIKLWIEGFLVSPYIYSGLTSFILISIGIILAAFVKTKEKYIMTIEEKLSKAVKLADAMYYAAQMISTDASHLSKAMNDWWNFKNFELNNKVMKELSVEEKAKAYDEAIEKLRDFYRDYDTVSCLIDVKEELANLFPALKESEEERIRKELIEFTKTRGGFKQEWIAWLENIPYTIDHEKREGFHLGYKAGLEKQGDSFIKWNKNTKDNKPQVNHSVLMKTTHGIAEGEWKGEYWEQYRWAGIVRDSDVLSWMELSDLEKQGEQDPWSEEDKKMTGRLRDIVEKYAFSQSAVDVNGDLCEKEYIEADNWLKSLKQKIGG